ncbi:MAG: hypothetical protein MUE97_06715 [Phycisphaerales bacterium]|jgi:hypothetical protein|nr:hypothetical protein [Phycisphaerales bacterium]
MGQGWSQYGHLIVIAIIFLSSVLSWVFRKLREQQQLKALRDAEARRRDEILRTGRDPAAEEAARTAAMLREVEAEARGREQAAAIEVQRQQAEMQRRRDELRRLREQRRSERTGGSPQPQAQAQPQNQPQPQPQGPVTTRELWPGGPVVVIARSAEEPAEAPRQTFPAPAPAPAFPRAEQPRPRQRTLASDREDYEESVRARQARADAAIAAGARQQAAQDRKAAAQRTPQTFPLPKTAAQWRAAIVANVILGQPGGLASNDGRSAFGPGAINTGGSPQP